MKKNSLLFIVALLLMTGFAQKSLAQATVQDIDWTKYAREVSTVKSTEDSPTFVYLYNVEQKKFLTCGGDYGMQGIFANVGMRFEVTAGEASGTYSLVSRVNGTQGDHIALDDGRNNIYIDRKQNDQSHSDWTFNVTTIAGTSTTVGTNYGYTISNDYSYKKNVKKGWKTYTDHYYMTINSTNSDKIFVDRSTTSSTTWLIVTEDDYRTAIKGLESTFIDVTGLLHDSRFIRNSKDVSYWKWGDNSESIDDYHSIGLSSVIGNATSGTDGLASPKGAYYAAEIDGEENTVSQTISNLTPGTYRVTCQGFYYNADGSENTGVYLFANDNKELLKTITGEDKTSYEKILSANKTAYTADPYTGLLKDNVSAGEYLANQNQYTAVGTLYENEIYVQVGEDGKLNLGISKTSTAGQAFFDNFKLYWSGTKEMYLSANNTKPENVDKATYNNPVRLNLRRAFDLNKWNALVLPMNLSGDQVKAAFGNGDAQLSELVGINPERISQIQFKKVNLDKEGLTAGKCYLVYVTKEPDIASNVAYTYLNKSKTVYGPLYQIEGVTQKNYTDVTVSDTYTTSVGTLNFKGYYYKVAGEAPIGSYIMGGGNMYYLNKASTVYGTTWVLQDDGSNPNPAKYSISINGVEEDVVTGIAGLTIDNGAQTATQKVFNLNGQMVKSNSTSLENLPKGIYIVNGKKYVVR